MPFKPSPPAAPDYAGAAKATAEGNLENARLATKANRINQVTPYGSLTYTQTGDDPDAGWTQTTSLSPQAQNTVDRQIDLSNRYAQIAQSGLDKASSAFENPNLDVSQLPKRAVNAGETAQEAIMSRLRPQLAQQEESLRARLANQGIGLGSEAYSREMAQQGQRGNDLQLQAALQGMNLDQSARQQAIQEQAYLQDRPLNLINALRSGAQVQNPTFSSVPQQQMTPGPDMMGAANNQYNAALDSYNTQAASMGGLGRGLFGLMTTPIKGTGLGGLFGM
jgi:hypothetical protein